MMDRSYPLHTGKELELMLAGKKPLAMFYRLEDEGFDETGGQNFDRYVSGGRIRKFEFSLKYKRGKANLLYRVFTLPDETWRFPLLKALKIEGQKKWTRDMEAIEGTLLGYTAEQNAEHLSKMYDQ